MRVKILTYNKCFNPFLCAWAFCLGAFLFLGYAARAGIRTPPSGRAAPPRIRHRPMIGRLFYVVILRGSRRLYKRVSSRRYPHTRNAYKRRYGHSMAAGRQSRRTAQHRPTAGRVPPGLHNIPNGPFLSKNWPLFMGSEFAENRARA